MAGNSENSPMDARQIMIDERYARTFEEDCRDPPPKDTSSSISFSRVFCCANSFLTTSKEDEIIDNVEISLCETKENTYPQLRAIEKSYEYISSMDSRKDDLRETGEQIKESYRNEFSDDDTLKQSKLTLYNYLSDDAGSIVTSESDLSQHQLKRDILSVPKFRSARLKKLRKRMTLTEGSNLENPNKLMKSAMSFESHIKRKKEGSNVIFPENRYSVTSNVKNGDSHLFSHLFKGCDCFTDTTDEKTHMASPYISLLETTEELAYDSDPEFFYSNNHSDGLQNSNSFSCVEGDLEIHSNDEEYSCRGDKKSALYDDILATRLMKEMTHGNINLIWHLQKHPTRSHPPTCVRMWIELGCRLQKQIIHPKLIWRSAYNEGCQQKNGRHLLSEPEYSGDIDLLDISRILILTKIDRQEFPLAIQKRSFLILTSDKRRLLFEASSHTERQRIVSGLKLLVAKLASMIIIGDRTIFDDFFHPAAFGEYHKQTECVNVLTA